MVVWVTVSGEPWYPENRTTAAGHLEQWLRTYIAVTWVMPCHELLAAVPMLDHVV